MKRRLVRAAAFWLVLVLMVWCVTGAGAHNGDEHNRELEKVFFGEKGKAKLTKSERIRLRAIECAAYLAIDQFNSHGAKKLVYLRDLGINNVPVSIDDFNFSGNHTHQRYTHMGWDEPYRIVDKARWKTMRKPLLLATVNHCFSFGNWKGVFNPDRMNILFRESSAYDSRCNSFAALIYYTHIIGDHEDNAGTTYMNMTKMPLARPHAGEYNPDIYSELTKHIEVLFRNQRKEVAYQTLLIEINQQAADARKIAAEKGGINTMEKFNRIHPYAEKLMKTLIQYIPELLKNEPFFTSCFPSIKNQ